MFDWWLAYKNKAPTEILCKYPFGALLWQTILCRSQ
jgi:hypothetical protein